MHQRSILSTLVLCTLLLLTLVAAYGTVRATPSEPYLVTDLYANNSASPSALATFNGALYFEASSDTAHGLWKSDGTAVGTELIYPGLFSLRYLTAVNGTIFFSASDGTNGWELWKSDGTPTGTMLVKDIASGPTNSLSEELTDVNGTLYFIADDGVTGKEIWKSDGTEAGTVMVKDIYPGSTSSRPYDLTEMNGLLYFSACDDVNGCQLWKSDGTEAGTTIVTIIYVSDLYRPNQLTNVNGTLYFSALDLEHGEELWKSDGTAAGTVMVKDIWTMPTFYGSVPEHLLNVNGTLYFTALCCQDGSPTTATGRELWKSNGTAAGTVMVKNINPGSGDMNAFDPYLTNVNGTLYFVANDGVHGYELWKSRGTAASTVLVKDINPEGSPPSTIYYNNLTNVNGRLLFVVDDGTNGLELWTSDGTEGGTHLVKDLYPDANGAFAGIDGELTAVGNRLFFHAHDGVHGDELWAYDPFASVTIRFDSQPDHGRNVRYTGSAGLSSFVLDDPTADDGDAFSNSYTFPLAPGVYTLTEAATTGWFLTAITCDTAGPVVDLPNRRVTLSVAAGDVINCTFTDQRKAVITALKYDDRNRNGRRSSSEPFLNGWTMKLYRDPATLLATQVTANTGRTLFDNLRPGVYILCEEQQSGWTNVTPAVNSDYGNQPCHTITAEPGKSIAAFFGNSATPPVARSAAADAAGLLINDLPEDENVDIVIPETNDAVETPETARNFIYLPLTVR
jgi:ELWxxDGT repeat protein